MEKDNNYKFKLGVFIASGLVFIILAVYFIGMRSGMFERNFVSYAIFNDVKGLKPGNEVRFSGINIGSVHRIEILNDSSVRVTMTLQEKIKLYLKIDATATISNEGLIGNKIINIIPGDYNLSSIEDEHVFNVLYEVDLQDIMDDLKESSENTKKITKNISEITAKIENGEGMFGKLFTDTSFMRNLGKSLHNIEVISRELAVVSLDINRKDGLLGMMIKDTSVSSNFASTINELSISAKSISQILATTQKTTGNVLDSSFNVNFKSLIENTAKTAENLNQITRKMNEGNGLVNRLIEDEPFADSVEITIQSVNTGAQDVSSATESLQNNWLFRPSKKKKK